MYAFKGVLQNAARIGGVMHVLVRSAYFGVGGVKARLHRATIKLRTWCKSNKMSTALRKFTQDNLVLKAGQFPETFPNLYIFVVFFVVWAGP